ncbi:hypothetical protein Slala05_76020 [Streptomyces lavendulae subsp. lavendulae]|nr:hypothetical protein Slala05_76020 [Streptomyces lavendulae subsp. lavendulae]
MVSRRETWTTEEFGTSHRGAVEAGLPDGSVPAPVYFDSGSGGGGVPVSQWSVYDGPWGHLVRTRRTCWRPAERR